MRRREVGPPSCGAAKQAKLLFHNFVKIRGDLPVDKLSIKAAFLGKKQALGGDSGGGGLGLQMIPNVGNLSHPSSSGGKRSCGLRLAPGWGVGGPFYSLNITADQ